MKVTVGDELKLTEERFKELTSESNGAKIVLVKARAEKRAVVKKG